MTEHFLAGHENRCSDIMRIGTNLVRRRPERIRRTSPPESSSLVGRPLKKAKSPCRLVSEKGVRNGKEEAVSAKDQGGAQAQGGQRALRETGGGGGACVTGAGRRHRSPGINGRALLAPARGDGRRGAGGAALPEAGKRAGKAPARDEVPARRARASSRDARPALGGVRPREPGRPLLVPAARPSLPLLETEHRDDHAAGAQGRREGVFRLRGADAPDHRSPDRRDRPGPLVRGLYGVLELHLRGSSSLREAPLLDSGTRERVCLLRGGACDRRAGQPEGYRHER